MKRLLEICFCACLMMRPCLSQPVLSWQNCYGGTNQDFSTDLISTPDGGYCVLSVTASNDGDVIGYHGGGLFDIWVLKLDSSFNIQWNMCYGNTATDGASIINNTSDNGFIIGGMNSMNGGDVAGNNGLQDAWIIKIDSFGNIQWQKSFGSPYGDACFYIEQTSDHGFIASCFAGPGGNVDVNYGIFDYWILKLDSLGDIQWQKTFGGSNYDYAKCIKQTLDGGYLIAGHTFSNDSNVSFNHGFCDVWIVKTDSLGNLIWEKSYGGSGYDEIRNGSLLITPQNEYIICVTTTSDDGDITSNQGGYDFWLLKIDSMGNILSQKTYGGSDADIFSTVISDDSGGYVLSGYTMSSDGDVTLNHNPLDIWMLRLDSSMNILWQNTFGGSYSDAFNSSRSIVRNSRGNYVIAGGTWSNDGDVSGNHGASDIWLFELNRATGIIEHLQATGPLVYPNPFRDFINIKYPFNISNDIIIQLTDLTGKLISTYNSHNSSATTKLNFNDLSLAPGVYFLKFNLPQNHTIKLIKY